MCVVRHVACARPHVARRMPQCPVLKLNRTSTLGSHASECAFFMQLHARKHDRSRSRVRNHRLCAWVPRVGEQPGLAGKSWRQNPAESRRRPDSQHVLECHLHGGSAMDHLRVPGWPRWCSLRRSSLCTRARARASPCAFICVRAPNHVWYERDTQGWQAGSSGRKGRRRVGRWARFG